MSLDQEEITRTPGTLGDPFRAIESLPGVAPIAWPPPIYAVRGSNPGNTGFFIDGLRVPALFHFALGPAVIHPYFLERLDFYPGGYPGPLRPLTSAGIVSADTRAARRSACAPRSTCACSTPARWCPRPWTAARARSRSPGATYTAAAVAAQPGGASRYWDYQLRADQRWARAAHAARVRLLRRSRAARPIGPTTG